MVAPSSANNNYCPNSPTTLTSYLFEVINVSSNVGGNGIASVALNDAYEEVAGASIAAQINRLKPSVLYSNDEWIVTYRAGFASSKTSPEFTNLSKQTFTVKL